MGSRDSAEPTSSRLVEIVLTQLRDLPPLPAVVVRLLQLTGDEHADLREVSRLIETDPPLAAKVLSLVRKADVGAGREVATVEKAVLLLGLASVRNLVLAAGVLNVFSSDRSPAEGPYAFEGSEFWKHCLAVACAAELLSGQARPRLNPHEAFVCGLLHDLGKIALFTVMPKSYDRVVRTAASRRASLADVERELIGVDHMIAGKRVAQQWQLPEAITACLWLHHHPPEALPARVARAELVRTVYLADAMAREMRLGQSGNFAGTESAVTLAAASGITEQAYHRVVSELVGRIEQRAELIGVPEVSGTGLYLEALGQANRELVGLNESLAGRNQALEARERLLEACSGFCRSLAPGDTIPKICQNGAATLRRVLPAEKVVVLSLPDGDGVYHLGVCDGAGESADSGLVYRPEAAKDAHDRARDPPATKSAGLLPRDCLARVGNLLGGRVAGSSSIRNAGRVVGMMFAGPQGGDESAWQAAVQHAEPLLAVIGVALNSVRTHAAAERLAEDLSEASRRLYESRHHLLRQRTLSMISEMASGAAHELNNPLAVIAGRAQMLSAETDPKKIESVAKIISQQAQRCSRIVSDLLQFARPCEPKPEEFDSVALLNEARRDFLERSSLRPDQVILEVSDPGLRVYADRKQVLRALGELMSNALEAMAEGEPRLHINCSGRPADEQVVIEIRDNGCGMSSEVLQRAFDPFYSHRPAGRGRGLGLCHAYRMAEINGGRLRLESTPGRGTTAWLTLPGKPGPTPRRKGPGPSGHTRPRRRGETVRP